MQCVMKSYNNAEQRGRQKERGEKYKPTHTLNAVQHAIIQVAGIQWRHIHGWSVLTLLLESLIQSICNKSALTSGLTEMSEYLQVTLTLVIAFLMTNSSQRDFVSVGLRWIGCILFTQPIIGSSKKRKCNQIAPPYLHSRFKQLC